MSDIKEMMEFLDNSPSCFHAVANIAKKLESEGYLGLNEGDDWPLVWGGKYYITRNGSSLIAFRIPAAENVPHGFMMSVCHSDRPNFKVKEKPEMETAGMYSRLAVERYGGMLMAPWLDRPLSIAGRIMVDTPEGLAYRLVDLDRDLCMIPNVAIHMNRSANNGFAYNAAVDMIPLLGSLETKGQLMPLLAEAAGCKEEEIMGMDLYLYNRQKSRVWGIDNEYISAQGLDDLQCAWSCLEGFLQAEPGKSVPMFCVIDNEEVGSSTQQGADSNFLRNALMRICGLIGINFQRCLSRSFMVSADNAHAVHPNHPEYSDQNHRPTMNKGVVIKFNASQKYTTDGFSAGIFRKACQRAGVPTQTFCNRADINGGSTLGNISTTQVSVPTVDVGLPQLAMHSCYETAGVKDGEYLTRALKALYGMNIYATADFVKVE